MKLTSAFLLSALFVQPAFANLDDVSTILAKGRGASFEATTESIHDPIVIEATGRTPRGKSVTSKATATPEEFAAAVRSKVPSRKIISGPYTYQLDWEKVTSVGSDGTLPLYDIVTEIKENMFDPSDIVDDRPTMYGYYGQTTQLLSVTGPIVSMRATGNNNFPGAAHPNYWDSFRTYDVRRLDKTSVRFEDANLLDIVEEASLVEALKKDRALAKLIPKSDKSRFQSSKSLKEMEDAVGLNLESCYSFPVYDGKLSAFAIHSYDVKSNEVAVRVALGAAAHVCQAVAPLLQLGLKVKATPEFRRILSAQVKNQDGLFMSARPKS